MGIIIVFIWFAIGIASIILMSFSGSFNSFMEAHPNIPLIYYLSWFAVLFIAGWLIKKHKNY